MKKKLKTKKTLAKRVKITKTGKILKKKVCTGHLKVKLGTNSKNRKKGLTAQKNKGHQKMFKKLLGKQGKKI